MSTAVENTSRKTTSSESGWLPRAIIGLVCIVALVLFVFVFGSVSGEEFNPWTFQRQRYKFVQIPFLRLQVMPTKYVKSSGSTANAIMPLIGVTPDPDFEEEDFGDDDDETGNQKLPIKVAAKPVKPNPAGRWDLVTSFRAASLPWFGESKIFCDLLDVRDHQGNTIWKKWTADNTAAAKVLWPIVAKTAQANLYVIIPDLLEIAEFETNPQRLQTKLNKLVVSESLLIGNKFAKNGNHERALQSFLLAQNYDAGSTTAAQGVAAARKAIAAKKADDENASASATDSNSAATSDGESTESPPAEVDGEFDEGL